MLNGMLEGVKMLASYISIYVPSTRGREHIDNRPIVHRIASEFSNLFGGATAINAQGAWSAADGTLVTEKVTIVKSYTDPDQLSRKRALVLALARDLKAELQQDAVSVESNEGLELI